MFSLTDPFSAIDFHHACIGLTLRNFNLGNFGHMRLVQGRTFAGGTLF